MANAKDLCAQLDGKTIIHNAYNGRGEERDRQEHSPEVLGTDCPHQLSRGR